MQTNKTDTQFAHRAIVVATACLLLTVGLAGSAWAQSATQAAQELSNAFSAAAKGATPAVVSIKVEKTVAVGGMPGALNDPFGLFDDDMLRRFFGDRFRMPQQRQREYRQEGQGSGFIISKDGYILTNNHVVGNVDKITVELQDGRKFEDAEVIGTDPDTEVALIKIEGDDFPVLPMGDSSQLEIGDWVIAIGNPFGLSETVTVGVISAVGRSNVHIAAYEDFIQTDAAINPGNSGGPLVNLDGRVIGINTAIYSGSGGYMGIGFAIPINMARTIADQLRTQGKVVRGFLGIMGQDIDADMVEPLGLETSQGIIVASVEDETPADRAGLQIDDIILELDGERIESYDTFRNDIAMLSPDTEIRLTVLRDGRRRTVTLTLSERPTEMAQSTRAGQSRSSREALGIQVQDLTREMAEQSDYPFGAGVIVAAVAPGSPASRVGLRTGDLIRRVNRQAVTSVDEFESALARAKGDKVVLLIQRGAISQYVTVELAR